MKIVQMTYIQGVQPKQAALEGFTFCFSRGQRPSVIHPLRIIPDTRGDLIGAQAAKVVSFAPWTSQKARMREHLERLAIAHGYVGEWLDYRDYQLTRVGQSYQYDVPVGKRGILAQFAGKRVRLVCVYSGPFRRWVRIGVPAAGAS